MASFLDTNGAPPRQTPQLQTWLALLADTVYADATYLLTYHSAAGTPTIPGDLNALFPSTPANNVLVWWKNTSTNTVHTYMYDVGTAAWITGPAIQTSLFLYHSSTAPPSVPADLNALFVGTPDDGTLVWWEDTVTGYVYTYLYESGWVVGPSTSPSAITGVVAATVSNTTVTLTSTTSGTFVDVTNSSITHTFTKDNALIFVHVEAKKTTTGNGYVRIVAGSINGATPTGMTGGANLGSLLVSDVFDVSALSGSQTIKLQIRTDDANSMNVYNLAQPQYTIVEWD